MKKRVNRIIVYFLVLYVLIGMFGSQVWTLRFGPLFFRAFQNIFFYRICEADPLSTNGTCCFHIKNILHRWPRDPKQKFFDNLFMLP